MEEWRAVVGYEGHYEVSSLGRVRGLDRNVSVKSRWGNAYRRIYAGGILKPYYNPYAIVDLHKKGQAKRKALVHRLMAEAFLAAWNKSLDVNHEDGDKLNNNVSNLRIVTKKENTRHYYSKLAKGGRVRLNPAMVREIRAAIGRSTKEMAEKYNVSKTAIRNVLENRTWFYV